jgi:trans-2,3-dihydro-3-hydroxyanthranilate isomerase
MDTRQVVLVDAFAAEPTGGVPVGVVPDGEDLTDDQLRAVASELDAATAALSTETAGEIRVCGPSGPLDQHLQATVGAFALGVERGWLEPGTHTPTAGSGSQTVSVGEDGRTWVAVEDPRPETVDVDYATVASALGLDVASLRDVGADLPPVRLSVGVDALAVPVNFLEHLGNVTPAPGALADLTQGVGVEAVCAFTFDTLAADAACHARTLVPPGAGRGAATGSLSLARASGLEVPVSPAIAGGVATHLTREGIIEGERPTVEQGHYQDRPAQVQIAVHSEPLRGSEQSSGEKPRDSEARGASENASGEKPRDSELWVGGRATVSLDGSVVVPDAEDDDILEA